MQSRTPKGGTEIIPSRLVLPPLLKKSTCKDGIKIVPSPPASQIDSSLHELPLISLDHSYMDQIIPIYIISIYTLFNKYMAFKKTGTKIHFQTYVQTRKYP